MISESTVSRKISREKRSNGLLPKNRDTVYKRKVYEPTRFKDFELEFENDENDSISGQQSFQSSFEDQHGNDDDSTFDDESESHSSKRSRFVSSPKTSTNVSIDYRSSNESNSTTPMIEFPREKVLLQNEKKNISVSNQTDSDDSEIDNVVDDVYSTHAAQILYSLARLDNQISLYVEDENEGETVIINIFYIFFKKIC